MCRLLAVLALCFVATGAWGQSARKLLSLGSGGIRLHSLAPNVRLIAIGDSITIGSVAVSFVPMANMAAGGVYYIPVGGNLGVGGTSTAQMVSGQLPTALTLNAKVATVMGGVNDIISGFSVASIEANLNTIYSSLRTVGCIPIAVTILPDSAFTGGQESKRLAVNAWIMAQPNILHVNMDATAYNSSATYTVDGLHPNWFGAQYVGSFVGAALASLSTASTILYTNTSDWGSQLTNADLAGTGGTLNSGATGVAATGWTIDVNVTGLTIVGSKSVDGSGFNHQIITFSGTSSGTGGVFFQKSNTMTWGANAQYEAWANVTISGCSGANAGFSYFSAGNVSNDVITNTISGAMRSYPPIAFPSPTSGGSGSILTQFVLFVSAGAVACTVDISRPTTRVVSPPP